jgi:hypothetical protein
VREIDFLPMSRILPAGEFGAMRSAFNGRQVEGTEALDNDSLRILSYVMGRNYERAETNFIRGLGLTDCTAGTQYSGFDMGSGEASLIVLLSRLQAAPAGSLIVIEELELGLHAEAQEKLVRQLVGLCLAKRLQIVCTSHSEAIIDSVPRRARLLLRRNGDGHEALENVSTRFAVHEMTGRAQPELVAYTEDRFAATVVEEAVGGAIRARLDIQDIGSNATLARQAVAHLRVTPQLKSLSVFDGDCVDGDIEKWIREERADRDLNPEWIRLPADGMTPERWVLQELATDPYRSALATELNCSPQDAQGHVTAMAVEPDEHDSAYRLSCRTGLSVDEARRIIARAVARTHPALDPLRQKVAEMIGG